MTKSDKKYVLAIDLGTSGSKSALADLRGEIIDFEFQKVPLHHLPEGGVEQDPEDWWQAIIGSCRKLLQKELVPRENIVAVCSSTQWAGTVPVDKEGNHLMNAMIWMDMRGEKVVRQQVAGPVNIVGYDPRKLYHWIRLTGGAPGLDGKDPVGHILYIQQTFPDIYARTYKFLEPKDYINLKLTGRFAASFDSIALHWVTDNRNLAKIDYHAKLLKITGLERDKLPDLKRSIDILGPLKKEVAKTLGLKEDIPVVMGSPDIQAAALGSGAVKDYLAHIYIGTSSWLSVHLPFKKTDLFHVMAAMPCPIPDRYLLINEQDSAGACLNFLRDNILYHQDELYQEEPPANLYQLFDKIAEKTPAGSHRVIFTPWLNGEKTPVDNNSIRAGWHNLSVQSNRGDMIRAVLEGVAFNQRWVLKYVERFLKRPVEGIHFVGGGANSRIWCQILADVLNRPLKQVADPIQANARGAVFMAAVALGHMQFKDIAENIQIRETFYPQPENRAIYDQLYQEYLAIYRNNLKMHQRLNSSS